MRPFLIIVRLAVAVAFCGFLAALPSKALAMGYWTWFWTTANDTNPLPFAECQRRAPAAISSVGMSANLSFSNPDAYQAADGGNHVLLMCIAQPRGFNMILDVSSDGGADSAKDLGQRINDAFWGTGGSQTSCGGSGWTAQADQYRGKNGARCSYYCPPDGTLSSRLWGTDLYTDDSSVCTAAVHAGLINTVNGGTVTIEIRAGADSYQGTTRYGVTSNNYGSWYGSFVFV